LAFDARIVVLAPQDLLTHQLWRHRDSLRNGTAAIALHACHIPSRSLFKKNTAEVTAMIEAVDPEHLTRLGWMLEPTYLVRTTRTMTDAEIAALPVPPNHLPVFRREISELTLPDFARSASTWARLFPEGTAANPYA
jgi:hypothetical protein